jgi:hypothetical protein
MNDITKFVMVSFTVLLALSFCVISEKDTQSSPVYLLSEHNLSIGLGPEFKIVHEGFESFSDNLIDSSTITSKGEGIGSLAIVSIPKDISNKYDPEFVIQRFSSRAIAGLGNEVIGNWTTTDALGKKVTIQTVPTNKSSPFYSFGKTTDIATWNLGNDNYAMLSSQFSRNITETIIRTLKISP